MKRFRKVVYKSEVAKHTQMKPKGNWKFKGRKVRVWANESRSFLSLNSGGRKWPKIGCLRLAEDLVNFIDFGGEEGAAAERRKRTQIGVFSEQATEFLPGILRLNVGEIAGRELCATQTLWFMFYHIFHGTKIQKFPEIRKRKSKYFGIRWKNVE